MSNGAENANASINLNKKLSQLEKAQQKAQVIRELPDGRTRYYDPERLATNPGPTKDRCQVVEHNPLTGQTRAWSECHDHCGNVNRVHPKQVNGQEVTSPHYPPTAADKGF